jgi:hypothetical protein
VWEGSGAENPRHPTRSGFDFGGPAIWPVLLPCLRFWRPNPSLAFGALRVLFWGGAWLSKVGKGRALKGNAIVVSVSQDGPIHFFRGNRVTEWS